MVSLSNNRGCGSRLVPSYTSTSISLYSFPRIAFIRSLARKGQYTKPFSNLRLSAIVSIDPYQHILVNKSKNQVVSSLSSSCISCTLRESTGLPESRARSMASLPGRVAEHIKAKCPQLRPVNGSINDNRCIYLSFTFWEYGIIRKLSCLPGHRLHAGVIHQTLCREQNLFLVSPDNFLLSAATLYIFPNRFSDYIFGCFIESFGTFQYLNIIPHPVFNIYLDLRGFECQIIFHFVPCTRL